MKKLKSAEEYTLQYENTVFSIVDVIRMVQIDAIKTTAENCAEEAEVTTCNYQPNCNNLSMKDGRFIIVNKDSILNVAEKMIEKL